MRKAYQIKFVELSEQQMMLTTLKKSGLEDTVRFFPKSRDYLSSVVDDIEAEEKRIYREIEKL